VLLDPAGALALGPRDLRQHLDHLGSVEDLEAAPLLTDRPGQLDLDAPDLVRGHVAVMDGHREALGLDSHAGHRRGPARQLLAHRPQHRLLGERVGMAEGEPRPLDLEPVAAGVDHLGDGHPRLQIFEPAPGDDRHGASGRAGDPQELLARLLGQDRVGRIIHDRRQGPVVVGHEQQPPVAGDPVADPAQEAGKVTHTSRSRQGGAVGAA
jgi:hypothetical protein